MRKIVKEGIINSILEKFKWFLWDEWKSRYKSLLVLECEAIEILTMCINKNGFITLSGKYSSKIRTGKIICVNKIIKVQFNYNIQWIWKRDYNKQE